MPNVDNKEKKKEEKKENIYKEVKQQAQDSIKFGEQILRKFARKQGLDEDNIKYMDMQFLGKNDVYGCMEYIKEKANEPKEADEILNMIYKKGLSKEALKELEKYINQ